MTRKDHLDDDRLQTMTQRYFDGSITPDELAVLQRALSADENFRRDFLLHAQVEITLDDMTLFHNYMDEPNKLGECPPVASETPARVPSRFSIVVRRILRLFNIGTPCVFHL